MSHQVLHAWYTFFLSSTLGGCVLMGDLVCRTTLLKSIFCFQYSLWPAMLDPYLKENLHRIYELVFNLWHANIWINVDSFGLACWAGSVFILACTRKHDFFFFFFLVTLCESFQNQVADDNPDIWCSEADSWLKKKKKKMYICNSVTERAPFHSTQWWMFELQEDWREKNLTFAPWLQIVKGWIFRNLLRINLHLLNVSNSFVGEVSC